MLDTNKFFNSAETPMCDIVGVLFDLDRAGHLTTEMQEAVKRHADNTIDTLPLQIFATARALASAVNDGAIEKDDAARIAWAIAGMGETLHGMKDIVAHFEQAGV